MVREGGDSATGCTSSYSISVSVTSRLSLEQSLAIIFCCF